MLVGRGKTLDTLSVLMPNMNDEISRIQNAALDSISRHSQILHESFERPFTPSTSTNFGGENGEVFSAIYGPKKPVPSFLHVIREKKNKGLYDTNLRAFTNQATPLFIADNIIDQVNYLNHWKWNVAYSEKAPTGSRTLRDDQAFRTICAARKRDDGDVETFLMAGLDSRCDPEPEGGRSNIYAWEYCKKGTDGTTQTYTGIGGTASRIHDRSITSNNHGEMQEKTTLRSHTVSTLEGPIVSEAGSAMRSESGRHLYRDGQDNCKQSTNLDEDMKEGWEMI